MNIKEFGRRKRNRRVDKAISVAIHKNGSTIRSKTIELLLYEAIGLVLIMMMLMEKNKTIG